MTLVKPSSKKPRATARDRTEVLGVGSKRVNQYTTAPLGLGRGGYYGFIRVQSAKQSRRQRQLLRLTYVRQPLLLSSQYNTIYSQVVWETENPR